MLNREFFLRLLLWILPVTTMLWPAFYNGFPLLYSDSGTYILAGYINRIPVDRPIIYCLFVRHSSLAFTLWITIALQSIMVCYLSWLFLKHVLQLRAALLINAIILILLSLLTGLSNYVSQIMPDIFTGALFFCVPLLLVFKRLRSSEKFFLLIFTLFFAAAHSSNLLLLSVMLLPLLFFRRLLKSPALMKWSQVLFLLIGAWLVIPTVNVIISDRFFISKTSNVFLSGSLYRMGILHQYVLDHCDEKEYIFCDRKEKMVPLTVDGYLWVEESPLFDSSCLAEGGFGRCWMEKDSAIGVLVRDIVTDPSQTRLLFSKSMEALKMQLLDFHIGGLGSMGEESPPFWAIRDYAHKDFAQYSSATQYTEHLYFKTENIIQTYTIYTSLILLFPLLWFAWKKNRLLFQVILLMLLFILANAAICSILSTPLNRYEARLIWILPYVVLSGAASFLQMRRLNRDV